MQWYYASNGQRLGPLSEAEFEQRVRDGAINAETLVWKQGMANWQPYGQVAPAGSIPVLPVGVPTDETEVCAVSGKRYPKREMIQFEGKWISAEHRDLYFQRLRAAIPGQHERMYAGFWIRFVAKILDGLILAVPLLAIYFVVFFLVMGVQGAQTTDTEGIVKMLVMQGFLMLTHVSIGLGYNWFFLKKFAATPGKMALGLKVIRPDGTPLTHGRIIGRFFAEVLINMLIFNIGYIIAAFDQEKRALHDHLCDTRVIKTR